VSGVGGRDVAGHRGGRSGAAQAPEARRLGPLRREWRKLLAQKRTWIGAGLLTVIPIVIAVMTKLAANPHGESSEGGAPLFMRMLTESGLYTPLATLFMASFILLPIAAAMVGGFLIAGEAEQGTLRTILVRPVRRGSMLLAKWVVGVQYLAVVVLLLIGVGLAAGGLLFGLHPIVAAPTMEQAVSDFRLVEVPVGEALGLIALSAVLVVCYLAVVMSIALLLSTLTDSSLTATIVTIVTMLVIQAVLQFSYLADLRPYWFMNHYDAWFGLLVRPVDWGAVWEGLLAFGAYTLVAVTAAWYVFRRKDVLS
jgi:ABC-2 type transport system permease protein